MNGVQKGQLIRASKINEIVANINSLHGDVFSSGRTTGLPSAFIIRGHLEDKKLASIDIFNNYYNDDSGSHKLNDKTYTGDQLNGVYGIYIVRERRDEEHPTADQTPRIMTNNELDLIEQERYQIKRLYAVTTDVEAGRFKIIQDCRQAADFSSGNGGGGGETSGGCSCDISAYYTEYDEQGNRNNKIATWTNGKEGDDKKNVDIYAPAGGGGAQISGWTGEFYTGYGLYVYQSTDAPQLRLTADTKLKVENGVVKEAETGSFIISRLDLTRHKSL